VQAFEAAISKVPALRLLLLSRFRLGELTQEVRKLVNTVESSPVREKIQIVNGFLEQQQLVEYIDAAQIVALPFELVPSDAPLSMLEAAALGKPVVTTNISCLPELAAKGLHFLAEPGDTASLTQALMQAATHLQPQDESKTIVPRRGWEEVGKEWQSFLEGH
jgi:glycosyltransferase involved in cell wall biosynthesis